MKPISIVGIIGLVLTITASLYYTPYTPAEEYTDSDGEKQYNEQGNNSRYGPSLGLWFLGMLLIGFWFKFARKRKVTIFAMLLLIIGQVVLWFIVHGILIEWFSENDVYGGIIFVIIIWSLSLYLIIHNKKSLIKLERKSFSKYVKDEILERQNNKCAMCNNNLIYCHFDHIDGNRSNNSISNCQALCANCHDLKTRREQKKRNNR